LPYSAAAANMQRRGKKGEVERIIDSEFLTLNILGEFLDRLRS
jgi:hypothetical protein